MIALDPNGVTLVGTKLVEASAGTGKTYAITALYVRLLIERGLTVDQILVVTYTRAATAELRDRIRERIRRTAAALARGGDAKDPLIDALVKRRAKARSAAQDRARLVAALHDFDQAAIYTIHSFCQRTLQDNAFESGVSFEAAFITDQGALLTEIAQDYWARRLYGAPDPFVAYICRPDKPRVTIEALVKLAWEVTGSLDMEVLPDPSPVSDEQAVDRWCEAHAEAARLWRDERGVVVKLLNSSPALKKNMYSPKSIDKWATQMDAAMVPGTMVINCESIEFKKFTSAGLAAGCKKGQKPPTHDFIMACDALPVAASALVAREQALLLDFVGYAREQLRRRKQAQDTQSFDDLLYQLRGALRSQGGDRLAKKIRERFRAALIDEFQDTDPVQYEVFQRVYHEADAADEVCLFLIGDPKQAIYAFRGADIFAYMQARESAAGGRYTLGTNWRSDPSLIGAVNALFDRAQASFVYAAIPFEPARPADEAEDRLGGGLADAAPFSLLFVPRSEQTAKGKPKPVSKGAARSALRRAVAQEIAGLLTMEPVALIGERPLGPGDFAVLCRTNREAADTLQALRDVGVPGVQEGDSSVFDSPEAAELERVLRAALAPHDAGAVKAALATSMIGVNGDKLFALQSDEQAWDSRLTPFVEVCRTWGEQGFIRAFRTLLTEHAVEGRLLQLVDGERRLTNLYHLGELLQAETVTSRAGPEALLRWLNLMRTDASAREAVGDAAQIRLESDADAVKLVTIHKAKGLQYPIVYCPFLWDGKLLYGDGGGGRRFHDPNDGNSLKLDLGSDAIDEHEALAEREALAENLRLLYVALTRARHRCTVAWGGINTFQTSALGYLLHQPATVDTAPPGLEALAERLKELTDEELLADLAELQAAAAGAIEVEELSLDAGANYVPPAEVEPQLACRQVQRWLARRWRTSSFSGLTAEARPEGKDEQERDHDALRSEASPAGESAAPVDQQVLLAELPRGAHTGLLLHDILERLDFSDPRPAALLPGVEDGVARHDFPPGWNDALAESLSRVLRTPLPGADPALTLCHVPSDRRLNELEFLLPVVGDHGLTAPGLARALAEHPDAPWPAPYLTRVEALGFRTLSGFCIGFADLIFEHHGRWYLADYKSNDLGPFTADYAPLRLAEAMAEHHYFLQYYLYLVALHRYLTLRQPGYTYPQHFGGVYYFFLRGMAPDNPPGSGVFFERPPGALVERLSALFGAAAPATAGGAS